MLLQTRLTDPGGDARRVECGDGPLWVVASEPSSSPASAGERRRHRGEEAHRGRRRRLAFLAGRTGGTDRPSAVPPSPPSRLPVRLSRRRNPDAGSALRPRTKRPSASAALKRAMSCCAASMAPSRSSKLPSSTSSPPTSRTTSRRTSAATVTSVSATSCSVSTAFKSVSAGFVSTAVGKGRSGIGGASKFEGGRPIVSGPTGGPVSPPRRLTAALEPLANWCIGHLALSGHRRPGVYAAVAALSTHIRVGGVPRPSESLRPGHDTPAAFGGRGSLSCRCRRRR